MHKIRYFTVDLDAIQTTLKECEFYLNIIVFELIINIQCDNSILLVKLFFNTYLQRVNFVVVNNP